jgi:hypothetical protein
LTVKALRLRGIRSMVQANVFLEGKFLAELNRRFAAGRTRLSRVQCFYESIETGVSTIARIAP